MASFVHKHGRMTIHFSDHALDRWWERCQDNGLSGRVQAMDHLRERLQEASWEGLTIPPWSRISLYNQARAEGFLALDEDSGFVVNKNASSDYVAVTYIQRGD